MASGSNPKQNELTYKEKYLRMREINNMSSKRYRQNKSQNLANQQIEEAIQEERNCILRMKHDSLLQEITLARKQIEAIAKLCPECEKRPYLKQFLNKKEKSMKDLDIMRHYIPKSEGDK